MRKSQRIKRTSYVAAGAILTVVLAGCSGDDAARTFGLVRDAPDEFQVTTRAPLSMPPDFQIRPPRPGAARPQEQTSSSAAEATLVPQAALASGNGGPQTAGQRALVDAAGPRAPADIRRQVEAEASLDQPDQTLTDRLMFWKPTPPAGITVDASKESQRLRSNAALGQDLEQGDTPIIQRASGSKGGFFSNLF